MWAPCLGLRSPVWAVRAHVLRPSPAACKVCVRKVELEVDPGLKHKHLGCFIWGVVVASNFSLPNPRPCCGLLKDDRSVEGNVPCRLRSRAYSEGGRVRSVWPGVRDLQSE